MAFSGAGSVLSEKASVLRKVISEALQQPRQACAGAAQYVTEAFEHLLWEARCSLERFIGSIYVLGAGAAELRTVMWEVSQSSGGATQFFSTASERLSSDADRLVIGIVRLLARYQVLDLHSSRADILPQGPLPTIAGLVLLMVFYNGFVFGYLRAARISIISCPSLLFHAFVLLSLTSFARVLCTDPGQLPEAREEPGSELQAEEASCVVLPLRAQYCRVLRRKVLRMDHHCPWLGNTIGLGNHKYFMLFMIYSTALTGLAGTDLLSTLLSIWNGSISTGGLPAHAVFDLIKVEALLLMVSVVMFPLLFVHCWLVARNMTTAELIELARRSESSDLAEVRIHSVHDQGLLRNVQSVMGDNPLFWLVPVGKEVDSSFRPAMVVECLTSQSTPAVESTPTVEAVPATLPDSDFLVWRSMAALTSTESGCSETSDAARLLQKSGSPYQAHSVITLFTHKLASCVSRPRASWKCTS